MVELGKQPAKYDRRTIQFSNIKKKVLPPIPEAFDVDSQYPFPIDNPMFLNDLKPVCVVAARGHATRRFEAFEQKKLISISDNDISNEYSNENGGTDGLVMLDSLKEWRNSGWRIGGRKIKCLPVIGGQKYDIYAFAQVSPSDNTEVKASIAFLNGIYIGLMLPMTAQSQWNSNQPWSFVPNTTQNQAGSWGGHAVYGVKYDKDFIYCITWARVQAMTWEFFQTYCDELYAVVDNRDNFLANSTLDVQALDTVLVEITK